MKSLLKLFFILLGILLFMGGCAQKVTIKALAPAEVGEMATKKKIAINKFKNDRYGLSGKIESKIARQRLNGKKYFTVVSRKNLNDVMREQRLQSSELIDERTATRVGKLIGAQAMINGEIASASATSDKYIQDRVRCLKYVKNQGCIKYQKYFVTCRTIQASVSANINVVDVETGSVIYGDTFIKDYSADSCKNMLFSSRMLSKGQALNRLVDAIASEFVGKLTPKYIYFEVSLLEDVDVDLTREQENRFEGALEYLKASRMDKSYKLLQRLLDEVDGRSYVIAYDLGVANEALGKLQDAKELYMMADDLATKPIEEINSALVRIDNLIAKQEEAKVQMDAK
jgi:tetratricopeptide (TPR) repeat protein